MTLSVRRGYRKMQPIFCSFVSGLHYRKTVKLYFRRISAFYLVVSIYENTSIRRFLSFLTAGNKSKCGTLQHLTDPQQSTVDPIFRPMSPSKRQASQRKPFALSSVSAQTSSRLRRHRTSVPPTPHSPSCRNYTLPPTAPHTLPPCPRFAPNHTHSHTPDTSPDAPPSHTPPQTYPRRPLPPHPHSLPTHSHTPPQSRT